MAAPEVLHCDNHVLVARKPAGLPCVPDESGDESLYDQAREWVRREYAKPGKVFLAVVHRLDRPVSGLVLFGRTSKGAERLSRQFREREVSKTYWGIVRGTPAAESGELEQWLLKDPERRRVLVRGEGAPGAKRALTRWRRLASGAGLCLLELEPRTGRSHQLRVACATLGFPLLGDLKYGARAPLPDKSIALHARELAFMHPTRRDERLRFVSPPPELPCWELGAGL